MAAANVLLCGRQTSTVPCPRNTLAQQIYDATLCKSVGQSVRQVSSMQYVSAALWQPALGELT